jgi:hypothetical protein
MRHVFSALCTRVILDQASQSLSMIEIVDSLLGAPDEKAEGAIAIGMDFVSLWTRQDVNEGGQQSARLSIIAPNKTQVGETLEYAVDLTTTRNARMVTRFAGFPFRGLGRHHIVVEMEEAESSWTKVAEWPVDVISVASLVAQKPD